MASVGDKLRRERLRRGLQLAQISSELKIPTRLLEAIEEERFERLPGGVFTKSFVRQYARALGLDEDQMAAEAGHLIESPFAIETLLHANFDAPIHVPPVEGLSGKRFSWFSWMPAAAVVIAVMLLCSVVYSRWQHNKDAIASNPETSTTQPLITDPQPAPETSAEPVPPPEASPESDAAAGEPTTPSNDAVRVELMAKENVWVSARAGGKILFSGTLTANETRTVEANGTLLLRVGNAGAVAVTLNGKSIGALGAPGQPRTVQFTPGGFQTLAASRPVFPL
jgi:cytoskeletal protein RodZ